MLTEFIIEFMKKVKKLFYITENRKKIPHPKHLYESVILFARDESEAWKKGREHLYHKDLRWAYNIREIEEDEIIYNCL